MATKTTETTEVPYDTSPPPAPPTATIQERMIAVIAELPEIGKTDWNAQQKFHFRSHDSVLNALNPLLSKHGVFVLPNVLERVTDQRTTGGGKAMYEVNLHVAFAFHGAAGDVLVASTWGEGTDMGDKATNKAMTMAFKAVLAQAFAVSTGENTDSDADTPQETTGRSSAGGRRDPSPAPQEAAGARVKLPASWREWSERMAALGVPERDQRAWLAEVPGDPKGEKFVNAKRLLVSLTEREGVDFEKEPRRVIQECIAEAFGGVAVAGPPWQIIATEGHLPTYEEYQAVVEAEANAAAPGPDDVPAPDAEDIPFGSD